MNYITYLKSAAKASAAQDEDSRKKLEEILSAIGTTEVEKTELPEASFEKMTYNPPTDEELAELAKSSLDGYKTSSVEAINSDSESKTSAKNKEIEKEVAAAEAKTEKIRSEYAAAVQDFENDAIKRGLARSSVAVNNSAAIRAKAGGEVAKAMSAAEDNIKSIEAEIGQLEVSRKSALDGFDIAYAAKLTEKINELYSARDAKVAEVIKYNNSITEKELSAAYEKAELESKLYTDALNQKNKENELADNVSASTYKAKYDAIVEYLSTLSKTDAKAAVLNDQLIRDSVNDYYYYHLYNTFAR